MSRYFNILLSMIPPCHSQMEKLEEERNGRKIVKIHNYMRGVINAQFLWTDVQHSLNLILSSTNNRLLREGTLLSFTCSIQYITYNHILLAVYVQRAMTSLTFLLIVNRKFTACFMRPS